jgi:hypothetical protein
MSQNIPVPSLVVKSLNRVVGKSAGPGQADRLASESCSLKYLLSQQCHAHRRESCSIPAGDGHVPPAPPEPHLPREICAPRHLRNVGDLLPRLGSVQTTRQRSVAVVGILLPWFGERNPKQSPSVQAPCFGGEWPLAIGRRSLILEGALVKSGALGAGHGQDVEHGIRSGVHR